MISQMENEWSDRSLNGHGGRSEAIEQPPDRSVEYQNQKIPLREAILINKLAVRLSSKLSPSGW